MKKDKKFWKTLYYILLIATIIDLIIPDPVPLIDEIILVIGTIYSYRRYK